MNEFQTDIVVVGAGLTGLTTAHNLRKKGADFLVMDRNPFVGGAIQTQSEDGFVFEKGPSTGVMSNDTVGVLFDELKEWCTLERAADSVNKRYILKGGAWRALPSGLIGGITTPLFRFSDKLRILGEPFRAKGTNPNETLADFVKRRLGESILDYAVDPFILGVYAGDPNLLVPRFALPKLYNLEQNYGSFIGGSVKMMRAKAQEKKLAKAEGRELPKEVKGNRIFSMKGGLTQLIQALATSAGNDRILLGIHQLSVTPSDGGYIVEGVNGAGEKVTVRCKSVITTTGAHELDQLLPFVPKEEMSKVTNLLYAKVVQVSIGFKHWDGFPLDAFGGLIPSKEKRDILGVLFPSAFLEGRAPKGGAMLSVFMGGVRRPDIFEKSDDELKAIVAREFCSIMKTTDFNPDILHFFRYREAIPQYGIDCEARFETLDKLEAQYPGLIIGGNLRNGIGMADRMQQGKNLAERVL